MKNNTPNLTPIEIVGNLDMVGTLLCMIHNGVTPPEEVMTAALIVLRGTRDSYAKQHGIGLESQHNTPAYMAQAEILTHDLDF